MTITHKISMDLVSKGIAPKFDMVQGDYCARQIEFRLFSSNAPWVVPDDALVMIRYRRPDKSVGVYNTLPDGANAYSIAGGNTLTIAVAPEVLAIPGTVLLVVTISTREQELSTFEVQIDVRPNLSSGAALDGNYASITGMLPIPDAAVSGQMLVVDEIGDNGKVRTVKAGDIPKSAYEMAQGGGYTGTETEFIAQLAACESNAPAYVVAEAERVAAQVQAHQNAYTVTFLAGADIHADLDCPYTDQMLTSMKHAAQAMEIIRKKVHIDFGVILGDLLWEYSENRDNAKELFQQIHACFHPAFVGIPQFWLKGDHDYLTTELTDQEVFAGISIYNDGVTFDSNNRTGGYFYKDFEDKKLRVIGLALPIDGANYGVPTVQTEWLNRVSDLTGKDNDWRCLLFSHMPISAFDWNEDLLQYLAYNEDFLAANIHGHSHNHHVSNIPNLGTPEICIPAISPYHAGDYAGNEDPAAPHKKVPGTAQDTAFCVVTVDLMEHLIFLDHYGAGEDRVIEIP